MMLVACLGRTPLLFLDFLSSLSNRDDRSTFTFETHRVGKQKGRKEKEEQSGWWGLVIVATETKGDYQLPIFFFFSVARAETPPQVSPW